MMMNPMMGMMAGMASMATMAKAMAKEKKKPPVEEKKDEPKAGWAPGHHRLVLGLLEQRVGTDEF